MGKLETFPDLVFIHSSFRTLSTWLWNKYRSSNGNICFYEPLNEFLLEVTADTLDSRRPENWRSGHPGFGPYFAEFAPLLKPDIGVAGMEASFPYGEYIAVDGPLGSIGPGLQTYLSRLCRLAQGQGKRPVIGCTRSIGRLAGIKEALGGTHIFLYRPLLFQWLSYLRQLETGVNYFVDSLGRIILQNSSHNALMLFLRNKFWIGREASGNFMGFRSEADAERVFLAVHLYLYAFASSACDVLIGTRSIAISKIRKIFTSSNLIFRGCYVNICDIHAEEIKLPKTSFGIKIEEIEKLVKNYIYNNFDLKFVSLLCDEYKRDLRAIRG